MPANRRRPVILLVDDVRDNREMYAEYLRFAGFVVEIAENGLEGLERAAVLLPDMILMDLSMPVMGGWEAMRRLKADGRTRAIPIVVLTAHVVAGAEESARASGCSEFLVKPCLPEDLVAVIRRWTLRRRPRPASGRQTRGDLLPPEPRRRKG